MTIETTLPEGTESPLVKAIKQGDVDAVAAAAKEVDAGADDVNTALPLAAKLGSVPVVEALLTGAFKPTGRAGGWNAAMYAAAAGHTDVLATLAAQFGAEFLRDAPGGGCSMTPLLLAALKGRTACAALILDKAADASVAVDVHGRNALHLAATGGASATIELLVSRGFEVDGRSEDGKTALMWAIMSHRPDAVGTLCRLGADPDLRDYPSPVQMIVPGKDMTKGEDAYEHAEARREKDPTLRHISAYLRSWKKARDTDPSAPAPPMPPLPWVEHAEAWLAAGGEAAAAAPEAATGAPAPADESDIFGADDAEDDDDDEGADAGDDSDAKPAATAAMASARASAEDLDDLD